MPIDAVIAADFDADANTEIVDIDEIPADKMHLILVQKQLKFMQMS